MTIYITLVYIRSILAITTLNLLTNFNNILTNLINLLFEINFKNDCHRQSSGTP